MIRVGILAVCTVVSGLLAVFPNVSAGAAAPVLTAAVAERMTLACIAYASMHQGAANIWIYDRSGEVLHFERMDGAPPVASPFAALDNAPDRPGPGDVPVTVAGGVVGRVRVAGMGPASDHACAEAAAAAAAK